MVKEVWKDIVGYEDMFSVSNLGRIYQKDHKDSSGHFIRGKIRKTNTNSHNYESFSPDKGKTRLYVHRVVAKAFLENKNNLLEVNHKDGNKKNNKASNLEWCTRLENIRHSRTKLKAHPEEAIKKKIFCVEEQKWYKSVVDFYKEKGGAGSSVSGIIDCPKKTAFGFHISSEEVKYEPINYTTHNKRWIVCVETGKKFLGVKSIAEFLGLKRGSVNDALRFGTRCGGYHWRRI